MNLLRLGPGGELSLTKHDVDKLPPYAILSHTWGSDEDEVTFDDLQNGIGKDKAGYAKILFCGQQALKDDLKDFWVDSCCINKPNLTELSEAIVSMFRWYQQATKCYVYLQDVSTLKRDRGGRPCDWNDAFRESRWFTRGWTLQELIAPKIVEFWSRDGHLLGTKTSLAEVISDITGIPKSALRGAQLSQFSKNEKLRWVSKRNTRKKEDKAYCMQGIFGVFLPPLYGEAENAFVRLEQEIERSSSFLHGASLAHESSSGMEATHKANRQDVLNSLKFDQMDSRCSTIKDAHPNTCGWILKHRDYTAWNSREPFQGQRFLWIAGKPGAGKSTLVKFALDRAERSKHGDDIIISFFFNARGDALEKSTIGMYRALLFQLLTEAPDLEDMLDNVNASQSSVTHDWRLGLLQELFSNAVRRLGPRILKCFVDALDECEERQVLEMVKFFEGLGKSRDHDSRLHICFASRHYPTIEICDGCRIVLEDQEGHADDIAKYIQRRLQAGKGKSVADIRTEVQEKASGVFMWVVLVVEILNDEFRRGRIFAVRQRLREIPAGLSDLFRDLLRRDRVNMDDFLLCLQWILFAKRPLRREEFYFAMEAGLHYNPADGARWRPVPWNPVEVTVDHMNSFVINASKGLAELTRSKYDPTVQFIHESIRDFLLKDGGLREIWKDLDGDLEALSHEKLKICCLNYLAVDVSHYKGNKVFGKKLKMVRARLCEEFPFLDYASKGVFHHANEAAHEVAQKDFLETITLHQWIEIDNLLQSMKTRQHCSDAGLLYILAEHNWTNLMEIYGLDEKWVPNHKDRYKYPIVAAFANGHQEALHILLKSDGSGSLKDIVEDVGFGRLPEIPVKRDLLEWAMDTSNWGFAKHMLSTCFDDQVFTAPANRQSRLAEIELSLAVQRGATFLVQSLLKRNVDFNAQGQYFGRMTCLETATKNQHLEIVKLLIDHGADLSMRSVSRESKRRLANKQTRQVMSE